MNALQSKTEQLKMRVVQNREGLFRFSMAQFLAALVVLIVSYPFMVQLKHGEVIENIAMTVILISAGLAVGGRDRVSTLVLVIPALAGPWMDHFWHGTVPRWIFTCAHMVFVGFVISRLLRFILSSTRVNSEVMCAGIAAYLMLGLFWATSFTTVSELTPGSFSGPHIVADQPLGRFDALYFSFVSLTCLGCGDITPISNPARMLLMVESVTGVLYLAVLIARLVALYSHSEKNELHEGPKT